MINKYAFVEGKFIQGDEIQNYNWIEIIEPTDEEIKTISKTYNIPRDYLYDVKDPYEVPRVEGLEDDRPNLFVLSFPVKSSDSIYYTRVVSAIVIDDIVITVRNEDSPIFKEIKSDTFYKVNVGENMENIIIELAWLISRQFNDYLKDLDLQIRDIEYQIKNTTKTEFLHDMIEIQRSLIHFRTGIKENGHVIESIFDLDLDIDTKEESSLLHDLQIENKQAQITVDKSVDMLENLSDLYSNVISNNLNTVVKGLTSITIVLTVPTIVGGLWGMNTRLPIENHPYAFWYLIGFTILISIIIIYILKKKDYL